MRLSYLIQRSIMETKVGSIINKFRLSQRRHMLFFNDIFMNYVKECEKAGYGEEIREISRQWGSLIFEQLIPNIIKKLPYQVSFNIILRSVLKSLGYLKDISFIKEGKRVTVKAEGETNAKSIGLNNLATGMYMGICQVILRKEINYVSSKKRDEQCEYVFEITKKPFSIKAKDKETYYRLNRLEIIKGLTLKDALKTGIFKMGKDNKIYLRGKLTSPAEPTLIHLFGSKGPILEKITDLSFKYFKDIVDKNSTDKEKLRFLKNILQVMGWGVVNIIVMDNKIITVEIKGPPYGFQLEKENWNVFNKIILGYMQILNKKYKTLDMKFENNKLSLEYGY